MIKVYALLLALLVITPATSLSTNSETIHSNPMIDDYRMRIQLDALASDSFTFRINFPTPAIGSPYPSDLFARIYEGTWNNLISPQPAGMIGTTTFPGLHPMPAAGANLDLSWVLATNSDPTGTYWFQIYRGFTVMALQMYELTIFKNDVEILKRTDILRVAPMKYIYNSVSQNLVLTNTRRKTFSERITLLPIDSQLNGGTFVTENSFTTSSQDYTALPQGFYLARLATGGPTTISYQGDPYTCPYDPAFPDTATSFPFCVHIPYTTASLFAAGNNPLYPSTYPIFDLGNRNLRDVVRIELTFRGLTNSAPTSFKLVLKDTSYGDVVPQPLPFNTDIPIPTGLIYETIFTVPVAGHYYLEVQMVGATMQSLQMYNIIASLTDGTILFNSVDILRARTDIIKFVYLGTPGLIRVKNSQGAAGINLYSVTDPSTSLDITLVTPDTTITSSEKSYYQLAAGYYAAIFASSAEGVQADIQIQTNAYTCLHNSATPITDPRNIFPSCTGGTWGGTVPSATVPPTYGDSLLQLTDDSDALARHNLGTLQANDRVYFTFDFLRPTEDTPSVFMPQILDSTQTLLATQPTGFGMTYSIPLTVKHQTTIYWDVAATGAYHLDVVRPGTDDANSFVIYELKVFKSTGAQILKEVDIVRNPTTTDFLYNLIYLSTVSTIRLWNTLGADKVLLFPMKSTNLLQTDVPAAITPSSIGPSITPKTFAQYTNLAVGWYGVRFIYTVGGDTGSASFQSYPYQCPYTTPDYTDIRADFDPCSGTMPTSAKINLHQAYVIQAHGCNPNQFFNGTCNNVDPARNCNTFNSLSGQCTGCPNSNYNLTAGWCRIPPTCPAGSTAVGFVCVSDLCQTSTSDGKCATCKSVLNEVKADGSCGLKTCPSPQTLNTTTGACDKSQSKCGKGYFEVAGDCYLLKPHCTELSPWLTCSKCETKYTVENGYCTLCKGPNPQFPCQTCSNRFYVNSSGQCSRVSQQCDQYYQSSGLCSSCRSGALPVNGICCPSGQTVQGMACVGVGRGGATSSSTRGVSISFLESAFFKDCGDVDTINQICRDCKPGKNFIPGTNLCA